MEFLRPGVVKCHVTNFVNVFFLFIFSPSLFEVSLGYYIVGYNDYSFKQLNRLYINLLIRGFNLNVWF